MYGSAADQIMVGGCVFWRKTLDRAVEERASCDQVIIRAPAGIFIITIGDDIKRRKKDVAGARTSGILIGWFWVTS